MSYNNGEDPFADLSNFRPLPGTFTLPEDLPFKATTSTPKQARAKTKSAAPFVKVPLTWVEKLREAKRAATHVVAYHVLYEWWKKPGEPVTASNVAFPSLSRQQKARAVAELETLGLVKVERQGSKAPRVTPLRV
jgi:hypothetical protein